MNTPKPRGADEPYQVIARRYRPRFFREVVGQEATAETLRQAILQNRLAHAYLFCGPRGVGKTSMARIFARSLQCPNAREGDPCDQCPTCDRIFRGEDMDVVEMDGASHRGIDDIRDLIQHVRYAPSSGRYRIFIIDEVHMLTREAFNALLKTLEEPPDHVKFVFATTEVEKVPATVLSRCQRCDFGAIAPADIVRRLEQITESEGAQAEPGLLEKVADLARGGMRDSQSLLDQLLSFAGTAPTSEDLDRITGRLSSAAIRELVDRLDSGDRAALVRHLMEIEQGGTDAAVVLEQIVEEYRSRLHAGVSGAEGGATWDDVQIERNLLAQEILQEARLRIRQLGRGDIVLELALLRISTLGDLAPLRSVTPAGEPGGGASSPRPAPSRPRPAPRNPPSPPPASSSPPQAGTAPAMPASGATEGSADRIGVEQVKQCLQRISHTLANMVGDGIAVSEAGDTVTLEVNAGTAKLLDKKKIQACEKELRQNRSRAVRIQVAVAAAEPGSGDATRDVSGTESEETPDIVERARDIFHGSILGAPPRPAAPRSMRSGNAEDRASSD